jgi:hypothetical protein
MHSAEKLFAKYLVAVGQTMLEVNEPFKVVVDSPEGSLAFDTLVEKLVAQEVSEEDAKTAIHGDSWMRVRGVQAYFDPKEDLQLRHFKLTNAVDGDNNPIVTVSDGILSYNALVESGDFNWSNQDVAEIKSLACGESMEHNAITRVK